MLAKSSTWFYIFLKAFKFVNRGFTLTYASGFVVLFYGFICFYGFQVVFIRFYGTLCIYL